MKTTSFLLAIGVNMLLGNVLIAAVVAVTYAVVEAVELCRVLRAK